ncbi:MAG: glycoside hydrolase family 97 catalytic domain-containing protein [Gaiellales bacterium]
MRRARLGLRLGEAAICCLLPLVSAATALSEQREPKGLDPLTANRPISVASPNGKVRITISLSGYQHLTWDVALDERAVVEPSPLGIVVDGVDLGQGVTIGKPEKYSIDERYPWRGVHAEAVNRGNGFRLPLAHRQTGTPYVADLRVFDDAVAFRHMVPGTGRRVPDAATSFRLPKGSLVWYHGLRDHYEAVYERRASEEIKDGDWAAPPVTFRLPNGAGYGSITEADLRGYAGMALQSDGTGALRERLAHAHPPGYPFTLRFGEEEAKRLANPAAIDGTITTPWRVVIIGSDLNTLVNSDVVHNLAAPPDPKLFPQGIRTAWLRPGRAVWRYLDGGENTPDGIKEFSRLAGELGFEYQVVEGQWQKWTDAELRDLVEYSKARRVGILIWRHRRTLGTPEDRRKLFASLRAAGVAGVKVDFLDHEAKEVIDLYQAILKDAAEHQLMINFHGANKPAGEARTWPNEMTREGIYGLEHKRMEAWAAFNATFPFTRMLAGHADYTPVVFGERRRETSIAHQIASAAILTSPLLVYGGHPASLLASPAVEIVKSIPSVWDETIVLPPSEIGELAMFARRSGRTWFVAAMNGPTSRSVKVPLSFLPKGKYQTLLVRDNADDAGAVVVERGEKAAGEALEIPMRAGGGFVVRIS